MNRLSVLLVCGLLGCAQDGADGEDGLVPETIAVCASVTTLPASGTLASLTYHHVTFSDGSAFVSCSASTTGLSSAGHSTLWAGWQNGAARGLCIVVSDASGAADGGWWEFTTVNGRPRAVYNDEGTADDQASFTFPLDDCPTSMRPD